MAEPTYTINDSPEVVERIETDLATIVDRVREADPHLRSLILTGGFARGEGTVVDGAPQNDYDLVGIRGLGSPQRPYEDVRGELEDEIGLHIDLARVPSWRLRWVPASIFWYETRHRGRCLWGEDLLGRIPIEDREDLAPSEGLRLLVNRAAGLLLVTRANDDHAHRIQAAKGLLAALDAHLFALGAFPPSQTERWDRFRSLRADDAVPAVLDRHTDWLRWALGFKVDPEGVDARDGLEAWRAAARAILDAVPVSLDHAGYDSLEDYETSDGLIDHLHFFRHAGAIPQAPRLMRHPTGRVRTATLRLLEASQDGLVRHEDARECLGSIAEVDGQPLELLDDLRDATLQ
jgi:hypothetical protein